MNDSGPSPEPQDGSADADPSDHPTAPTTRTEGEH